MKQLALALALTFSITTHAQVTVEESRLEQAMKKIPASIMNRHDAEVSALREALIRATSPSQAIQISTEHGRRLWQQSTQHNQRAEEYEDRSLYWSRLNATALMRDLPLRFEADTTFRQSLIDRFEWSSRGMDDIRFQPGYKRILITGFDPFLLDRRIDQANPSGVAAQMLDGMVVELGKQRAQIEAVIFPVRFADFDSGIVERFLAPYLQAPEVDMVVTLSMGREGFDLEHFPGRRRSAKAPDNLNVTLGTSLQRPRPPRAGDHELEGPEFVEFSLPVMPMLAVQTPYLVRDNHKVLTLQGEQTPSNLDELKGQTAVEGSGGGYLSNEISYRSLLLRQQLGSNIPMGHLHTPAIQHYKRDELKKIVQQIEKILQNASQTLTPAQLKHVSPSPDKPHWYERRDK